MPWSWMSTPSYSVWAARIVRVAEKPKARLASCCRVEVMKGGAGARRRLPLSTLVTA